MNGAVIAFDSADIVILGNRFDAGVVARETGHSGYRKMRQTISLTLLLNDMGAPPAATGLIDPAWAIADRMLHLRDGRIAV